MYIQFKVIIYQKTIHFLCVIGFNRLLSVYSFRYCKLMFHDFQMRINYFT